jgi:phasin
MNVMTAATYTATEAKAAKRSVAPSGPPMGETPKFETPKMEVPAAFHEFAQKGVAQAKDNYEKIQTAADEITSVLEQTYATAAKGVVDYNLKLIEMTRANSNSAFEFTCDLITMKSLPEMLQLSTEQARRQFELATAQNKELWALAERMATESTNPVRQSVAKAFNKTA